MCPVLTTNYKTNTSTVNAELSSELPLGYAATMKARISKT